MSDEYEDVDELEQEDADDDQEGSEDSGAETSDDGGKLRGKTENAAVVRDESAEHTIAARQAVRDAMERQIQEFLARGGKISQIDADVTADPPRKPGSEYGRSS